MFLKRREKMQKNYTWELAGFLSGLDLKSVPSQVIQKIKWAILDNIGCIIGASTMEESKRIADLITGLRDNEEATALGYGFRTSTRNSAFLNATLMDMSGFQDGYSKGAFHPSVVIPSAMATAEHYNKTGNDLILSAVIGYEVGNRISEAMAPSHIKRGFAPHGTAGTIGSAVATGKLMGFDQDHMANAIGIAGLILPVSVVENYWDGYTSMPILCGTAARSGIESALYAEIGLTACPLEAAQGFCNIVSEDADLEKVLDGLGERYTIDDIYFKPYASCRTCHPAIDVVLDLVGNGRLVSDDIESILVKTDEFTAPKAGKVRTNKHSKFGLCQLSMPYNVAVAIMDGQVGLRQVTGERIMDQEVHRLADRVKVIADPEMDRMRPANRPAIVEITLRDGQMLSGRVDYPKGDPRNPMSDGELLKKFEDLVSLILSRDKAERIYATIMDLENIKDINELVKWCS
jgi:2-methylcitrate dehydratase PrpD